MKARFFAIMSLALMLCCGDEEPRHQNSSTNHQEQPTPCVIDNRRCGTLSAECEVCGNFREGLVGERDGDGCWVWWPGEPSNAVLVRCLAECSPWSPYDPPGTYDYLPPVCPY